MFNYNSFAVESIGYSHSHATKTRPMQDSAISKTTSDYSIAVISDGHGSAPYLRSDRGSKIASRVGLNVLENIFLKYRDLSNINLDDLRMEISDLLQTIWLNKVWEDYQNEPFSDAEFFSFKEDILDNQDKETQERWKRYYTRYKNGKHIQKAYGCTLIGVLICENYCIGIHVGDGKCVAVYDDGTCDQPIPWDDVCVANYCSSMCDEDLNCRIQIFKRRPIAVFLASDGIDDTFGDGGGLYNFYRKICYNIVKTGNGYISTLKDTLPVISEKGSKDDISIAGVFDSVSLSLAEKVIVDQLNLQNKRTRLQSLMGDLNNANYKLRGCESALDDARTIYSEKEKILSSIKSSISSLQERIKQFFSSSEYDSLDILKERLLQRIKYYDIYIKTHQEKINSAQQNRSTAKQEYDSVLRIEQDEVSLRSANDDYEVAEQEYEAAKTVFESKKKEMQDAQQSVDRIKGEIAQLESEIKMMESSIVSNENC